MQGLKQRYIFFFSKTDEDGQLYGLVFANGRRWLEQRKLFAQYLAGSKDKIDEIVGDEVSRFSNEVYKGKQGDTHKCFSLPAIFIIILQVSARVGPLGNVIEINTMFMYSVNSVLWRLITGRPIEPQTASRITFTIREAFRVAERSSISDILQVRQF